MGLSLGQRALPCGISLDAVKSYLIVDEGQDERLVILLAIFDDVRVWIHAPESSHLILQNGLHPVSYASEDNVNSL
ncbi:unnamed protein product [Strongylus vulgaris]|uniref:Uncharacterized protein n=1 Tax=Strongylus vulgaris TaxID=40348 RepID=A0A3P7IXM3_STRVU|nr:unnamed protein product [Strongylus vulgaris]